MMVPILGMDISKDQIDVVLLRTEHKPEHTQIDNSSKGFKLLWRFLKKSWVSSCSCLYGSNRVILRTGS
jgi:hypothetical protein